MKSDRIPFVDVSGSLAPLRAEMLAAVAGVIDRASFILGEEVDAFEREFAACCGVDHVVTVSNGLDALSLALRAAGVGVGDEVIVPSQTFIASWMAVSHVGATPVPVDIDREIRTLDAALIEAALTPRTRAIMPVHLYGHPADMAAVMRVAEAHGLFVLEDAAQAHGAEHLGRRTGGLGHAAGFSFYPTKNLGALGDAGAVTTNDADLANRLRSLRNYGSTRKYHHDEIGYNARMDEMQAAILRVRLRRLDDDNENRRRVARLYDELLQDLPELRRPVEREWAKHVYHLYVVETPRRDELARHLAEQGIATLVHYPFTPGQSKAYSATYGARTYPVGDAMAAEALSLPIWPGMLSEQVQAVAAAVRRFHHAPPAA